VIVRRDSGIRAFAELRGRSWAYNEPLSHSGFGITRYHLVTLGETDGFFGEVVEAGFHERSVRMVRDRAVDAAAIDSQVLAVELRDHPELAASLVVVDALGPSTIQPVAVSRRFPPGFHEAVRDVLVGLHRDPAFKQRVLGRGMVERFVAVGPEAYDDIRRMVDACEAAGFTKLR
jgi:phosphonate transport system substrate-binding protein